MNRHRMIALLALLAALMLAACGSRTSPEAPAGLFREVAAETGLNFQHFIGATGEYYILEIMGAGGALLDYDNDGDLDVYLLQGTLLNPAKTLADATFPWPASQKPGHRLFRNELVPSGTLRFTDVTETAGVGHVGYGMGAATGDYNNDGFVDLYVTDFGANVLYRNNGDGTFTDVTKQAGVNDDRWSTGAAFFDYDRDGDLDLFVLNYLNFAVKGNKKCYTQTGEIDYCTPKMYHAASDRLFRNEGNGTFRDVSESSGISASYGPGLGIVCADFDGDGWIDVYVANDTKANLLWLNQRNGTFREAALERGAAYSEDGVAKAGMGVTAADFDGDGDVDLLVVNLRREGATLFLNHGGADFEDVTIRFGLRQPTFPLTGFGLEWFDYDNDGLLDLFVANGAATVMEEARGNPYPFQQRNLLLRYSGEQRRYTDVAASAGPALALAEVSRGAAFGDIDNDGDIDILQTNNNGPVRLLLNEVGSRRNWLTVKLEGVAVNRQGLGARVAVVKQGGETLWRRAHTDSSYCSASDPRVHFGLGNAAAAEAVLVQWPDGTEERWDKPAVNTLVTLRQGSGRARNASAHVLDMPR